MNVSSYCSWGSQGTNTEVICRSHGKNTEVICHSLLQDWTELSWWMSLGHWLCWDYSQTIWSSPDCRRTSQKMFLILSTWQTHPWVRVCLLLREAEEASGIAGEEEPLWLMKDSIQRKWGERIQFSSVQLLSHVWLFVTPWTAACQASLSITNFHSLLKLMSIELVMPSSHLILCRPLLPQPSILPSIRVFSNESVLHIRWPKYWSFSFSISPSN